MRSSQGSHEKVYLELSTDGQGSPEELEKAKQRAQYVANHLGVTVQLSNGNTGAYLFNPQKGGSQPWHSKD